MASDNVIFERVMRMPALDSEWSIEEQTDDQIIFKGEFGHACVKADGKVISQVPPYVAALEAAIRGEELPQKPTKAANLPVKSSGRITSRSQAGSVPGSALEAVRECQSTEKATYSTGGKRLAASAKTNIAALMEAGGSLEILSRVHRTDFIEVIVRAKLPKKLYADQEMHVDSSISIYKQEYLAKKAWDWIVKILMDEPGIVIGTDEYGMPEFAVDATIKVRISDEGKSVLVALPAKIALWRELAREWQFAGRVCETKAMSRAADMLLRGDFQSSEEKAEEQSEIEKVAEGGRA